MTVAVRTSDLRGMMCIDWTGVASVANAGQGQIANPEGVKLLVLRTYIYFATGATGATNLDVGFAATGIKGTNVLSTFDGVQATVGAKGFYGQAVPVNEAQAAVEWSATDYLTFSSSGSAVGLAAKLFVEYLRVD